MPQLVNVKLAFEQSNLHYEIQNSYLLHIRRWRWYPAEVAAQKLGVTVQHLMSGKCALPVGHINGILVWKQQTIDSHRARLYGKKPFKVAYPGGTAAYCMALLGVNPALPGVMTMTYTKRASSHVKDCILTAGERIYRSPKPRIRVRALSTKA